MPEFYIGLNSDIVFLLNVTGSMSNSLPSLKIILTNLAQKIEEEVKKISHSDNVRYKVCGFRDQEFDGDKWFIDLPFVRNIEEVSNHLNHKDMEPFGGTGKATSLLDAIYKIGMMPVNASKTIEDSNKWRKGGTPCIFIISNSTFKNATLPEIAGFGCLEIFNKIADKCLAMFGLATDWNDMDLNSHLYSRISDHIPVLFGLVPGSIGYDYLSAWPHSRFNYYIREEEITGLGKAGPEGDAAQIAAVTALEKMSLDKDTFKSLIDFLVKQIGKKRNP